MREAYLLRSSPCSPTRDRRGEALMENASASGVVIYRSGLASVINNISQPSRAYVSPQRVNNKLGCKRRANERLVS